MQRGFVTCFIGVVSAFAVSVAFAQGEGPVGGQDKGFIGPPTAAVAAPGPEATGQAGAAVAVEGERVEARALGTPSSGSFRDQMQSRERARLGETDARVSSLKAGEGWWRTAGALVVIIALIVALGALVRRWAGRSGGLLHAMGAGGRAPSGILQVLGRYPVGRGQTLILLKLDRRVMLVCQSMGAKGGGMRTLCEITDPEEIASIVMHAAEAEGRTLSARFREMVSGYESSHEQVESVALPVEFPEPRSHVSAAGPDPVGRLNSRLDSLRQAEWGDSA